VFLTFGSDHELNACVSMVRPYPRICPSTSRASDKLRSHYYGTVSPGTQVRYALSPIAFLWRHHLELCSSRSLLKVGLQRRGLGLPRRPCPVQSVECGQAVHSRVLSTEVTRDQTQGNCGPRVPCDRSRWRWLSVPNRSERTRASLTNPPQYINLGTMHEAMVQGFRLPWLRECRSRRSRAVRHGTAIRDA